MSLPGSPPVVFYDSLRSGGLTSKGHVECGNRYCPTSGAYPGDKDFLAELLMKYERFVKPSFEKYIEPTKKYSDIILPNYGFSTEDKLEID